MKNEDLGQNSVEGTSNSRRNLLKALTAGGAAAAVAPSEWTKPALKSIALPAHAQTTGGGDDCNLTNLEVWGLNGSFSMSITLTADADCGGRATMTIYNEDGLQIGICTNATTPFGNGEISWSCSADGGLSESGLRLNDGETTTVSVEFEDGCSCTFVRAAS